MSERVKRERRKSEGGAVIVFVTISLVAMIGLAAWATETGRTWQAKNQLQAVADSAALAGVGNLLEDDYTTVNEAAARGAAMAYGPGHNVLGTSIVIATADIDVGSWDLDTSTFTPMNGSGDSDLVRAVRVRTRRDASVNGPIPTILGRAIGIDTLSVVSEAIAYQGFAGSGGPGAAELPIAIDCCAVAGNEPGASCGENYCEYIASHTPNPCLLASGETTTCLEFHSTPEQNACWTEFNGDSPSISTPGLTEIVGTGNPDYIDGDDIYLDNGNKTPVIKDIRDRFLGLGDYSGDPSGIDTDLDGDIDSWVVRLPVAECQNPGDGCATGQKSDLIGFICFDIHEVIPTPDKIIKGDFVCSTDERCKNTGLGPGGGLLGGLSAQYPVLVH